MKKILITGSEGLIGQALIPLLHNHKFQIIEFDNSYSNIDKRYGDVTKIKTLRHAAPDCIGIINLAAVSRVAWGQKEPEKCLATNFHGMLNVLQVAREQIKQPWVIFSSSREVYGQPDKFPVHEDMPLRPMNTYAESKCKAEEVTLDARNQGLQTAIVRLSNVYGCIHDHVDRVVPAFARAAAFGHAMRVDGWENVFDFTHISDTVRGIMMVIERLQTGVKDLPPIHLLTGKPTTLGELATLANRLGKGKSNIYEAPERDFDVTRFYGDPTRANTLLDWTAQISIEKGLQQLINDFVTHETNAIQKNITA